MQSWSPDDDFHDLRTTMMQLIWFASCVLYEKFKSFITQALPSLGNFSCNQEIFHIFKPTWICGSSSMRPEPIMLFLLSGQQLCPLFYSSFTDGVATSKTLWVPNIASQLHAIRMDGWTLRLWHQLVFWGSKKVNHSEKSVHKFPVYGDSGPAVERGFVHSGSLPRGGTETAYNDHLQS